MIVEQLFKLDTEPLEWMFLIVFPHYCFGQSLRELVMKHQMITSIAAICEEISDIAAYCELTRSKDIDDPCCSGELHQGS